MKSWLLAVVAFLSLIAASPAAQKPTPEFYSEILDSCTGYAYGNAMSPVTCSTTVPVGIVTGFGTGVLTALELPIGTAGAPILTNGALGTPSSGNLKNATGYQNVAAVYNALDPQWGTAVCGGSACATGTGGDDSGPINTMIAAAAASTALSAEIQFPPAPSGYYNVCANPIIKPYHSPVNLTLRGSGSGQGGIRILPTCSNQLYTVIHDNTYAGTAPAVTSIGRMRIENLRVDAWCKAPHDLIVQYDPGFSSVGSVYRNVTPSLVATSAELSYGVIEDGGSNIFIQSGYEYSFDYSNRTENVNDTANGSCYGAYSAGQTSKIGNYPPYSIDVWGTDGHIQAAAIGASIANIVQRYGGENQFNSHGWGYGASNPDSQAYSQPLYTYITRGITHVTDLVFDSPVIAGLRAQVMGASTGIDYISAVTNAGSGGTPGSQTVLTGVSGTGTKWTAIGLIGPSGSLSSIPWILTAGNYSVNPSLTGETTTATNGLTGVVVNLVMGTGYNDTNGPMMQNVDISFPGGSPQGISVGAGVLNLTLTGSNFSGISPANCVVPDTTLDSSTIINDVQNCATSTAITSSVVVGSAVALTSGSPTTVTSISLPIGVWDIQGNCGFIPTATTATTVEACAVNTSSALGSAALGNNTSMHLAWTQGGSVTDSLVTPVWRVLVTTANTPVYLVAQAQFTVSTDAAFGFIRATRGP